MGCTGSSVKEDPVLKLNKLRSQVMSNIEINKIKIEKNEKEIQELDAKIKQGENDIKQNQYSYSDSEKKSKIQSLMSLQKDRLRAENNLNKLRAYTEALKTNLSAVESKIEEIRNNQQFREGNEIMNQIGDLDTGDILQENIQNMMRQQQEDMQVIFENKVKKIFNHPFKIQDINTNIHQTRDNFELTPEDKPFNFYMEHKTQFKNVYSCNYNTKDLEAMLNNALTKLKIQEFNFIGKDTTNDDVFNSLIDKEREELLKFFNSNKSSFINSLSFNSKNNSSFIEQVSALIYTENAVDVYSNKIKQEISKISKNKNEFEIKYLTIMLVGKSGQGKSTLINGILKEDVAEEGMGKFKTIKTESYQSKNMPIFRLIDTRGIELNQNYGAKEVELESKNYINQQYLKNDPNNFIHCIWYCFTGKRFEDVEIELLNYLRNSYGENKIPIIIVHTQSLHKDEIVEMEN